MAWTPLLLTASIVPKWMYQAATQISRSVHDEHYDCWPRFGKKCLPSAWRRYAREREDSQTTEAVTGFCIFRSTASVSDWHGGLRRSPFLGSQAHRARPHCKTDGTSICEALREDQQE